MMQERLKTKDENEVFQSYFPLNKKDTYDVEQKKKTLNQEALEKRDSKQTENIIKKKKKYLRFKNTKNSTTKNIKKIHDRKKKH